MNYCILNGKKSTLIKGLLIQSLPIITKPMMRTNIETVDGRDGDIVTKLGYAAYDKTMSIGLFGDYDIDEVIEYFSSEGTVIFSNEPDKYYKYQILNQIDFTRLSRFKTATVTFHVQPFKYSAVDEMVSQTYGSSLYSDIHVVNRGNVISRPTIELYPGYAGGWVQLSINGRRVFSSIELDLTEPPKTLVLDGNTWEAYWGGALATFMTQGDFAGLYLDPGDNVISISPVVYYETGQVEQIDVTNISRWI